jgi:hypothetical protein
MPQRLQQIMIWMISLLMLLLLLAPEQTATADEQRDSLLQTYLQMYEIDREVERLTAKETKRLAKIAKVRASIKRQDATLDVQRERAGVALRNYYMQEPGQWLTILLSAQSLSDALIAYDLLDVIFRNDMQRIQGFLDEYEKSLALERKLAGELAQLANERAARLEQRQRVERAQAELTRQLAKLPDGERTMQELKAFAKEWQTRGLPRFHQYFATMAKSISALPKYIVDKQQYKGTKLFIYDHQLNEFLRMRDPMFRNTNVRFERKQIVVTGEDAGIRIKIAGKYTVLHKPVNTIRFEMTELRYQNYALPDTTIAYLASLYDLSIYPKTLTEMIEATAVEMEDGKLTIKLKFSF